MASDVVGASSASGMENVGSTAMDRPASSSDGCSAATSWRSPLEHGSSRSGVRSSGGLEPHIPSGTTSRAGKVSVCEPKHASAACGPSAWRPGASTGRLGQGMVAAWSHGVPSRSAAATQPDGSAAAASPGPNGST